MLNAQVVKHVVFSCVFIFFCERCCGGMGAPQKCTHDMRTPEDAEKEEEEKEEEELQDLVFSSAFQWFVVLKRCCVCMGTPKRMLNALVVKHFVFNLVLVRDVSGNTAVWQ